MVNSLNQSYECAALVVNDSIHNAAVAVAAGGISFISTHICSFFLFFGRILKESKYICYQVINKYDFPLLHLLYHHLPLFFTRKDSFYFNSFIMPGIRIYIIGYFLLFSFKLIHSINGCSLKRRSSCKKKCFSLFLSFNILC